MRARTSSRPASGGSETHARAAFALLAVLVACRDDAQTRPPPAVAPVHITVTKVSPASAGAGVLDIEIQNNSDEELGCYRVEIAYQGSGGATLAVRINGRDRRATTTSLSGGDGICRPHSTCTAQLKYLTIPAGAVTATVRPLTVKAMNARRTGCEETPLIDAPMTRERLLVSPTAASLLGLLTSRGSMPVTRSPAEERSAPYSLISGSTSWASNVSDSCHPR